MNNPLLYSKYNSVHIPNVKEIIENHLHLLKLKENANILDVGVGDGTVTLKVLLPHLPTDFKKLVLSDISENMVKFAKKQTHDARIDTVQLDISSEAVPVEFLQHFDHIFSFNCLNWIVEDSQTQAMKNIFDMLKPGGNAFLKIVGKAPMFDVYEKLVQMDKWTPYMRDIKQYISVYHHVRQPTEKLRNILEKVGFDVGLCKVDKRAYIYPSWDYLLNFKLSLDPFLKNIPEKEFDNYVSDIEEELRRHELCLSETCDGIQKCHMSYEFLIAVASKPI